MGSLTQQVVAAPITSGPPQVEGTGESGGLLCKGYTDTSTFSSLCFPHQHCCWVSYPPYPSCFIVFSFRQAAGWPSGSSTAHCVHPDVWVGGQPNQRSGWSLSVVSTIVAIDLTTDQWDFLVLNQLYHRHVVQTCVWPCQGWTVVHLEKSHRVNQTESISVQVVVLSLSPPPLKTLPTLQRPWITEVPKTSGTTPAGNPVGPVPLSNSSDATILGCDPRYDRPLSAQSWPAIRCRHRISQVVGNGLGKPSPNR
jgi:hypothetical protein